MISIQKRFLFVHIRKTAGNSIQTVLKVYSDEEFVAFRPEQDGVERFGLRNPHYKVRKHSTLAEYRQALGPETFGGLYKFTCVRNPWDRMISYYFQPTIGLETWNKKVFKKVLARALSLSDYLRLEQTEADPLGNVNFIMRFEHLDEDFRSVCSELDIPAVPLPVINRSSREHYTAYYDDELRELVRRKFAPEIERFGYSF